MQLRLSAAQVPAKAVGAIPLARQHDAPETANHAVKLRERWLQRPTKSLDEIDKRGVPFSALNE
jgi:hypothetical protein